jgi:uncharacterized protein (TIRG00374 family)
MAGIKLDRSKLTRILVFLALAALLTWPLRNVPLLEIWLVVRGLHAWQLGILLLLNGLIYVLLSLRWWLVVRAGARKVPFWPLLMVRVAVFGVSYFTLGPQVGGEPLQVLALQRRYGLSYSRATASVLMDKLLEFLVNFLLLAIGLSAILRAGLLSQGNPSTAPALVLLSLLIAWPPVHIILMYFGRLPLSILFARMPFLPKRSGFVRFIRASEWMASRFCRRHLRALLAALLVSLLAGCGMLLEYGLVLNFLAINLPFWTVVAGWTAGWLSFLVPLPGGLGALEASQVFVLGAFGIPVAQAIGVTLLVRARDLLVGGFGLLLAGNGFSRVK